MGVCVSVDRLKLGGFSIGLVGLETEAAYSVPFQRPLYAFSRKAFDMQNSVSAQTPQAFFSYPRNPLDEIPTQGFDDADPNITKWAILTLWERGEFSAKETIFWLVVTGVLSPDWVIPFPNEFLRDFVKMEKAKAEIPQAAPEVAKVERTVSPAHELLDAIAPARVANGVRALSEGART